jgi:hypothetical protein
MASKPTSGLNNFRLAVIAVPDTACNVTLRDGPRAGCDRT